jgi:hypothetical protein
MGGKRTWTIVPAAAFLATTGLAALAAPARLDSAADSLQRVSGVLAQTSIGLDLGFD